MTAALKYEWRRITTALHLVAHRRRLRHGRRGLTFLVCHGAPDQPGGDITVDRPSPAMT